jgi:hypothetical protein
MVVKGGNVVQATITLNSPAPQSLAVKLNSANSAATVPALVGFLKGVQTMKVNIPTSPVNSKQIGKITASYGSSSIFQMLTVEP